ncbi:hypothetical protein TNCT_259941 [Trichonephila clavata]|uniref:Uncharacterized protein n=1 Tax=Trichonephila clavata TaxID=2740835 RepID=A0A8X6LSR6_TRICU|nr:hypothetical protein TNCT_259941 [Trichonephila clavata]
MAFLGRSRKEDLRILATELGLAPSDNLKIIELKDLRTKSDGYDEEFVKDVLNVIVKERTTTEKQKAMELEDNCCGPTTRNRIRTVKVENSTGNVEALTSTCCKPTVRKPEA